jgi:hypothetical protein
MRGVPKIDSMTRKKGRVQHPMKIGTVTTIVVVLSALALTSSSTAPGQATNSPQLPVNNQTATNTANSTPKPPKKEPLMPPGTVNVVNINLPQFLEMYGDLANAQVDTSRLQPSPAPLLFHFTNTNAVTRPQLVKLLDQVLLDQARIVAIHSDKGHIILEPSPARTN